MGERFEIRSLLYFLFAFIFVYTLPWLKKNEACKDLCVLTGSPVEAMISWFFEV